MYGIISCTHFMSQESSSGRARVPLKLTPCKSVFSGIGTIKHRSVDRMSSIRLSEFQPVMLPTLFFKEPNVSERSGAESTSSNSKLAFHLQLLQEYGKRKLPSWERGRGPRREVSCSSGWPAPRLSDPHVHGSPGKSLPQKPSHKRCSSLCPHPLNVSSHVFLSLYAAWIICFCPCSNYSVSGWKWSDTLFIFFVLIWEIR